MKRFYLLFAGCAMLLSAGCHRAETKDYTWVKQVLENSFARMKRNAVRFEEQNQSPRSWKEGRYRMAGPEDWTSGFFPGSLWYCYRLSGDETFKLAAQRHTSKLFGIREYRLTHDLGFMMYCSYGNQYRCLKDSLSAAVLIASAESLISRVNDRTGLIRSWDFGAWNYPVIIDNMMNLEMLFWASRRTGDPRYACAAIRHADVTLQNHFREDGSCYHVVSYNDDGTVESRGTFQGYADESAWARGQAWALYGYTMVYRETLNPQYLQQARKVAAYIESRSHETNDLVPRWDYDDPAKDSAPRDASAAAVTASALFELSHLTGDTAYYAFAEEILRNLAGETYFAGLEDNGDFLLKHSVGNLPNDSEIDVPLNYADYYFLEAIVRYLEAEGVDARTL